MNLFELNENYRKLQAKFDESGGISEDMLKDTLDSIDDERSVKLDNVASWIDNNNSREDWLAKKIKDLSDYKKHLHNQTQSLMEYMTDVIDKSGYKSMKTEHHILKPRNYRASVVVSDSMKIPKSYILAKTEERIDKKRLYKDLKAGTEVPGAHLEPNRKTRIL